MQDSLLRKLFLSFIQIHILHHAREEAIYGAWMIEELAHHGYSISPGTIYPIFHKMEKEGLLSLQKKTVEGKMRKYYSTTTKGEAVLDDSRKMIEELKEIFNHQVGDFKHTNSLDEE